MTLRKGSIISKPVVTQHDSYQPLRPGYRALHPTLTMCWVCDMITPRTFPQRSVESDGGDDPNIRICQETDIGRAVHAGGSESVSMLCISSNLGSRELYVLRIAVIVDSGIGG